jgi:hypothetical protein
LGRKPLFACQFCPIFASFDRLISPELRRIDRALECPSATVTIFAPGLNGKRR